MPPALGDTALRRRDAAPVADAAGSTEAAASAATRGGTHAATRSETGGEMALVAAAPGTDPSPATGTQPRATSPAAPPAADPAPSPASPPAGSSSAAGAHPAPARAATAASSHPDESPAASPRPFSVGETLQYEVRFGPIALGRASMQVIGVETVRGIPAYHTRFQVRGGNALYRVDDVYQSWIDTRDLSSLRYWQDIDEGSYEPKRRYEIFPDRRAFVEEGKGEQPSVAMPLDEGSFLYWLRTIPLEVGKTYTFDRYFRPDRNPVTIRVLRRERVRVPAGEFDAIVVQPTIKTKGLFSEGGRAEVWFADDSTRAMVQMKSRLSIGSLSLHLKSIEKGR